MRKKGHSESSDVNGREACRSLPPPPPDQTPPDSPAAAGPCTVFGGAAVVQKGWRMDRLWRHEYPMEVV